MTAAALLDDLLDRTIAIGYSRMGFSVRERFWSAPDPARHALAGTTVLVTGANSGIGKAIAAGVAALGATVLMTVRDQARRESARRDILVSIPTPTLRSSGAMCRLSQTSVRSLPTWAGAVPGWTR